MINGLQLTIPGEEVRRLLEQRLEDHRQRADWWKREQARTPKEQTEDEPLTLRFVLADVLFSHFRIDVADSARHESGAGDASGRSRRKCWSSLVQVLR
jgi:hypothetical protein